jgi:hypothetical protein
VFPSARKGASLCSAASAPIDPKGLRTGIEENGGFALGKGPRRLVSQYQTSCFFAHLGERATGRGFQDGPEFQANHCSVLTVRHGQNWTAAFDGWDKWMSWLLTHQGDYSWKAKTLCHLFWFILDRSAHAGTTPNDLQERELVEMVRKITKYCTEGSWSLLGDCRPHRGTVYRTSE